MKFSLLLSAVLMLVIYGCSSSKEAAGSNEEIQNAEQIPGPPGSTDAKNKAMEYFINGSIYEAKGDNASAILEF